MMQRKPEWLRIKIQGGKGFDKVNRTLKELSLNTVCMEANCPNRCECYSRKTATFMVLGRNCTRNCTFCNVTKEMPENVDIREPYNVAKAVQALNLKHAVITSVTRDDMEDGGASHFVKIVEQIRKLTPETTIELLIPDFKGSEESLRKVVASKPEIINHNIETVPVLYEEVRPMAVYERSLELLRNIKRFDSSILSKSGFMLGFGETKKDVTALLKDLKETNCDIITIGQYLQPSSKHHPVVAYIPPDIFKMYEDIALDLGFKFVFSGPLVRSSYYAEKVFQDTEAVLSV